MQILDGKKLAQTLKQELKSQLQAVVQQVAKPPHLTVILVGEDPASQVYVGQKIRSAKEVGISSKLITLPKSAGFSKLLSLIKAENQNPNTSALLVQLPLPKGWPWQKALALIDPAKDADGLTPFNQGQIALGNKGLIPCTPMGIMSLLKHYRIPLEGQKAVVVGRSPTVGLPSAQMLLRANATVTVCHSRTKNLSEWTRLADIVIVAAGVQGLLGKNDFKKGAVVVDVGIHRTSINGKTALKGDVRFSELEHVAFATPVPGGVGPMTVVSLLQNTYALARQQAQGPASKQMGQATNTPADVRGLKHKGEQPPATKLKETPLMAEQRLAGAKFMPFHGWKLASEFGSTSGGAKAEHLNVRKAGGVFDISHIGKIRVKGRSAGIFLEYALSNRINNMQKNRARYSLMCNEGGGIIDDLLVYCWEPDTDYLLCVNASSLEKDLKWLNKQNNLMGQKVQVLDETTKWAGLALQGPKVLPLLPKVLDGSKVPKLAKGLKLANENEQITLWPAKKNQGAWFLFCGEPVFVCATGYTGERGFEVFMAPALAKKLWRAFLEKVPFLLPTGLLARDTLRIESQYPLYGNELTEQIDPHSAGLSWAVKKDRDFIGRKALSKVKVQKRRVGFSLLSPKALVPRKENRILVKNKGEVLLVGEVTSGAFSPSCSAMIGMGYVLGEYAHQGAGLKVDIRGHLFPAKVVSSFLTA